MDIRGSPPSAPEFSSINGLKFGKKIYFGDHMGLSDAAAAAKGSSSSSTRVQNQNQQIPRCQVEGCGVDLSDAKGYYSRHKVCGAHSKTSTVVVNGLQQRFCQQCSRFHLLAEFDQGKRSCRRRLAGHNERRRKPSPGSMLSPRYGRLSSSFFDNTRTGGGFLLDFSAFPKSPRNETAASSSPHLWWQNNNNNSSSSSRNPPPPPPPPNLYGGFSSSTTECYNAEVSIVDSSCALSLLSNEQQWISSRTRAPPIISTPSTITTPYPTTWSFKADEGFTSSNSDIGLGHSGSQLDMSLFPRPYGSSDHQHINWSL